MPRPLDETFLRPHPRTVLWWKQRVLCRRCKHHEFVPQKASARQGHSGSGGGEICVLLRGNGKFPESCINAREGAQCGPDAKLFEARNG